MANPWDNDPPAQSTAAPWEQDAAIDQAPPVQPQKTPIQWDAVETEVRAAINALPRSERKAAIKEWSKRKVALQRQEAGGMQSVYDVGRNLVRGTPVGSFLDEGLAGARALAGGDYEEEVALERARNDAADAAGTKLGSLPIIGDVTTAGVTKLAGGIASAPLAPMARVFQGMAMLPRMGNAALSGMGYGALYGAGEGEGAERATNAAIGGTVGAVVGGATPPIAQGIGNAVAGVRNMGQQMPVMLQPYSRGAVDRVARAASDDGVIAGANPSYQQQAQQLGPEGMLADMGSNLRGQAGAIANAPGRGQTRVVDALSARRDGAPQRITQDMDAALGVPVNVPRTVETLRKQANQAADPFYQQFYSTPIKPTPALEATLRKVPQLAWARAQQLAEMEGIDLGQVINTGRGLDLIKRGVDDIARDAGRGTNLNRLASNIARDLRNETDRILSPNDPRMSSWAQARRAAGDGLQFDEAAEMGQGAFRKNLTPDQMDMDMSRMNPLQTEAYRVGARDSARTTMGNAGTAFGPNGDTAARRVLQTDFGAEKVRRIARNPSDADRLAQRLDTETTFAKTQEGALANSVTSRRIAAQKEFPAPTNDSEAAARVGARSMSGVAMEGVYRLGNLLTAGALNAKRARIADDAAQMLMAQGVSRDAIAQGLRQFVARGRLTADRAAAVSRMIERLERSAAPAQVGSAGRPMEVTVYPPGDPRNSQ